MPFVSQNGTSLQSQLSTYLTHLYVPMQVAQWGGKAWIFGNAIAFNAPEIIPYTKRKIYKSFFVDNLRALLPCLWCRKSFIQYSDELPIEAFYDSRAGLAVYWYKIHSAVNSKLSKQDISFFDYVKQVESMRAKCSKSGAKGCTEPHIEKNNAECRLWSDAAWDKYGNIDIEAWKRRRLMCSIFYWSLLSLVMVVLVKILLRFIIKNRANKIIKLVS